MNKLIYVATCFLACVLLLSACTTIPKEYPRTESHAFTDTRATLLGEEVGRQLKAHPGQSAVLPLYQGIDALAARLGLALYAQKSLDVQYYIWRGDATGVAVAAALLHAADRGVRVRLLLDDLQASAYDPALLALDEHPNIEVRMFNPSAARSAKAFEFLSRFSELNRRMHNKSFIADNQMAIVGGRNVGDEYFSASQEVDFADFDVLTIGPVVPEISATFDMYWNSELAVPISVLHGEDPEGRPGLPQLRQKLEEGWHTIETSEYAQAVRQGRFVKDIEQRQAQIYWGEAKAVADTPDKFLTNPQDKSTHLGPKLLPLLDNLHSDLFIVSPYFVPGDELVAYFAGLVKRGVKVTILTNSFASNDVAVVYAGYAKYRKALLEAGVDLYEYKPNSVLIKQAKQRGSGLSGSSRASLHAKVFVFDRKRVFVGSLNLDPRSVKLNSELGVLFENPTFASSLVTLVENGLAANSYHIRLVDERDAHGELIGKTVVWDTLEQGKAVTYTSEPHVGVFKKIGIWFMSLFVPEEML